MITLIKYCDVFTLQNGNSTIIKWLNQIFALFLLAEVVCNHKRKFPTVKSDDKNKSGKQKPTMKRRDNSKPGSTVVYRGIEIRK